MITKVRVMMAAGMTSAAIGGLLLTTASPASAGWISLYHGPYSTYEVCDASRWPASPPDTYVGFCNYYAADPDQYGADRGPGWYFPEWFNTSSTGAS